MIFIAIFGIISFVTLLKALFECRIKRNAFGKVYKGCDIYGSFVWADHIVFGAFWTIVSLITVILQDSLLFLLTFSVFWLVRSIGETIYWFLQQFAPRKGNEPEKFLINYVIRGEATWFVNQIAWQCITVVTFITTIYLSYQWLTR
jgi:hypothetical protein